MGDGLLGKCKDCTRKDTADRAARLSVDPEWVEKEMERHRQKARRQRVEGTAKKQSPEKKWESTKSYRRKYPEKHHAHMAVRRALLNGTLIKMPCQQCGELKTEAHHDDYSQPMEVLWLCKLHHAERHVELRRKERLKTIH